MDSLLPSISVVMPLRTGMPWLSEQLGALASQDWDGAWELVVADNGSVDGSLEEFTQRALPTWRVVDAKDAVGISHARNVGVAAAVGDFILFCDADDVVATDWVRRAAEAFERSDYVAGHLETKEINSSAEAAARLSPTAGGMPTGLNFRPYAVGANFGIRRSLFLSLNGCDESFQTCGDDVDLSWRATAAGTPPTWYPDMIVHYRLRGSRRALLRQQYSYGRSDIRLFVKFRAAGCPRPLKADFAREWWFLVTRVHLATKDTAGGFLWAGTLGRRWGRLRQSFSPSMLLRQWGDVEWGCPGGRHPGGSSR
jgi:GT2 family glycosyltransferase